MVMIYGNISKTKRKQKTWEWDKPINELTEKKRLWKLWKNGGSKADYITAEQFVKRVVFEAKRKLSMKTSITKMSLPCSVLLNSSRNKIKILLLKSV